MRRAIRVSVRGSMWGMIVTTVTHASDGHRVGSGSHHLSTQRYAVIYYNSIRVFVNERMPYGEGCRACVEGLFVICVSAVFCG